MHTVQRLLKTSKYERHEIDRRFHALAHLHNVCVKHACKCMIRLQHDKRYAELRQLYNELVKNEGKWIVDETMFWILRTYIRLRHKSFAEKVVHGV